MGGAAFEPRPRRIWFLLDGAAFAAKSLLTGLHKLGFPWILSSESSLFKGLTREFRRGPCHERPPPGRFSLSERLEIVGEAVDLVHQALPLFGPCSYFATTVS